MGMSTAERSRRYRERNPDKVREVRAAYRARNRDAIRETDRQRTVATRAERRAWLDQLKVEAGCADCGYNAHPRALDFDHIGTDKLGDVGRLAHHRIAIDRLMAEIAKCEVVCANCHRVRTWRREQGKTPKPPPAEQVAGQIPLLDIIEETA